MSFPIDVSGYKPLSLDPVAPQLTPDQRAQWETNIRLVRDTIILMTAASGAKGLSGHTGGAYSIVPEVLLADGFMRGSQTVYPVLFDEAGHRVAIQYAMAAFNGEIEFERLLHYREYGHGLYGHPELDRELGIKFSSGRLGHVWPFVNGVALAHPDQAVVMFGSDGSQMEGNDAEAARLAVAKGLNVKLLIDDNNVTISGHPSDYLPGFDVSATLRGHGLAVDTHNGEDLDALYTRFQKALTTPGPVALVNKRPMAPGVPEIENSHKGHEVISVGAAVKYLEMHGQTEAAAYLQTVKPAKPSYEYMGSSKETGSNRTEFGKIICGLIDKMPEAERTRRIMVIDSDLEGSTGIKAIHEKHPDVFVHSGVMERGNFSAAAGFGFERGQQGVFATFSAFLEMVISEATMARLNHCNAICHFSHAGVDEIADNTCHFGINAFFADSTVEELGNTRLYFAADAHQLKSLIETVFDDEGLRFVFTTRSKVPFILKEDGTPYYGEGYRFQRDRDEVIREGRAGYVVSYGELLYRALDAVDRLRADGVDVGLINKPTLNVPDEAVLEKVGRSPFVLVVEGQNRKTGLGTRYGTWLLERGLTPTYGYLGATRVGLGGIAEQIESQGLAPADIRRKVEALLDSVPA